MVWSFIKATSILGQNNDHGNNEFIAVTEDIFRSQMTTLQSITM